MSKTVRLHDEFDSGEVALWAPDRATDRTYVPDGTAAVVLGRSLSGYLLVQVGNELYEVWHECTGQNLN